MTFLARKADIEHRKVCDIPSRNWSNNIFYNRRAEFRIQVNWNKGHFI
jgi:hypothetical protein